MKISTKGRYGLRAMIDLAIHSNGDYVSLRSITERQHISLNYLEHSFAALKNAGLITGLTGSNGGYKLADDPKNITIQMILSVLEGDLSVVERASKSEETLLQQSIREQLWDKINADVQKITTATTLQDMAEEYQGMQGDHS